jgi:hypothetical protein
MHRGAVPCTAGKLARVARALWPRKTAAHLAHGAHCSLRAAKYMLAGRPWSGNAVRAVIRDELD